MLRLRVPAFSVSKVAKCQRSCWGYIRARNCPKAENRHQDSWANTNWYTFSVCINYLTFLNSDPRLLLLLLLDRLLLPLLLHPFLLRSDSIRVLKERQFKIKVWENAAEAQQSEVNHLLKATSSLLRSTGSRQKDKRRQEKRSQEKRRQEKRRRDERQDGEVSSRPNRRRRGGSFHGAAFVGPGERVYSRQVFLYTCILSRTGTLLCR